VRANQLTAGEHDEGETTPRPSVALITLVAHDLAPALISRGYETRRGSPHTPAGSTSCVTPTVHVARW
jgi:hypothetical protein